MVRFTTYNIFHKLIKNKYASRYIIEGYYQIDFSSKFRWRRFILRQMLSLKHLPAVLSPILKVLPVCMRWKPNFLIPSNAVFISWLINIDTNNLTNGRLPISRSLCFHSNELRKIRLWNTRKELLILRCRTGNGLSMGRGGGVSDKYIYVTNEKN